MYCPHRWGLNRIGCAWNENMFVTRANILHKNVHNHGARHVSSEKKVYNAVQVYNDLPEYQLFGITDCIEVIKTEYGDYIDSNDVKFNLNIVEHKPTKPKCKSFNDEDFMQIFAQKICADYTFSCDVKAEIYYADVRRKYKLPINDYYSECDAYIKELIEQIRRCIRTGSIPAKRENQYCNGCSMKDLCMPSHRKHYYIFKEIERVVEADDCIEGEIL